MCRPNSSLPLCYICSLLTNCFHLHLSLVTVNEVTPTIPYPGFTSLEFKIQLVCMDPQFSPISGYRLPKFTYLINGNSLSSTVQYQKSCQTKKIKINLSYSELLTSINPSHTSWLLYGHIYIYLHSPICLL